MLEYLNPSSAAGIIGAFLNAGGPVVTAVGVTAFAMCALIGERLAYLHFTLPRQAARARERWAGQTDHSSWAAHRVRELLISQVRLAAEQYLGIIRVLVMVVPLLGLLGTVTGMVLVFDGITSSGSNARVLAEGISRATIPTMTGLAVALVGMFFINLLERNVSRSVGAFADSLDVHERAGAHGGARAKRRITGSGPDQAEVDITPLLDIVFILLIFFIVTATFVRETGLPLQSPQDDPPEEQTTPPPSMLLSVREDGLVMVNNLRLIDPRSVKPVIEEFRARSPNGVVLVSVAPLTRAEATVTVLDQSRQAGVEPAVTEQRTR